MFYCLKNEYGKLLNCFILFFYLYMKDGILKINFNLK